MYNAFPYTTWPELLDFVAKTLDKDADRTADLPYPGMSNSGIVVRTRAAASQVRYLADLLTRVTLPLAEAVDSAATDSSLYVENHCGGATLHDLQQLEQVEEAIEILRQLGAGPPVTLPIKEDPTLPPGTVQFRDPSTGRVLGTIINLEFSEEEQNNEN